MRDGRRQRLGLVDGTDGTVQDTYLDRILSDVEVAGEPNILSLDPDANVRTTDQRYVSDAYNYYLGGGPDAAQDDFPIQADNITGGGNGAGDASPIGTIPLDQTGVTGVNTPFEQNLLDQGVGVQAEPGAPISAPGEGMLTQEAIDDLANYPVNREYGEEMDIGYGEGQVDPNLAAAVGGKDTTPLGGANLVTLSSGDVFAANDPLLEEKMDFTPETQGLVDIGRDKINDIGQSISDALGTAYDKVNQTIEIAGKKINLASTAAKVVLNKYIGGPISLVIDALGAMDLPGGPTLQTSKAQSIGLAGEGQYQDKYGINTQSAFGDYDKYAIDKEQELQEKFDDGTLQQYDENGNLTYQGQKHADYKEYNKISGVDGDVEGDQPGMTIAEELGLMDKIDPGLRVGEKEDIVDIPTDVVNVQAVEEAIEKAEAKALADQEANARAQREMQEQIAAAETMEAARQADIDRQNREAAAAAAATQRARDAAATPSGEGAGAGGGSQQATSSGGFSSGWGGGWGWAKGGRVRYSEGGIVSLKNAKR